MNYFKTGNLKTSAYTEYITSKFAYLKQIFFIKVFFCNFSYVKIPSFC